jgi:endoglucanase
MVSRWREFMYRFLSCGTPSGFEEQGQKVWIDYLEKVCGRIEIDSMGNVMAWSRTVGEKSKTIMVVGHCDEIGLMVTHISDKGYIHFTPIGGVDVEILQGSKVVFLSSGVEGVIGRQPIHLQEEDKEKSKTKFKDLWIDIGASSKGEACGVAPVGSVAHVLSTCSSLRNDLISCRGLDDKVGALVAAGVTEAATEAHVPFQIVGVSTVQEEIGLCGAKVVANSVKPDAAFVVDVGFASDTPDEDDAKRVGDVALGKGPMVNVGAASNRVLRECVLKASEMLNIPVQIVPEPNETGTDADSIRLSGSGIPTVNVSIPVRYMHTPVEVCSLSDVDNAVWLILKAAELASSKKSFAPF